MNVLKIILTLIAVASVVLILEWLFPGPTKTSPVISQIYDVTGILPDYNKGGVTFEFIQDGRVWSEKLAGTPEQAQAVFKAWCMAKKKKICKAECCVMVHSNCHHKREMRYVVTKPIRVNSRDSKLVSFYQEID